MSDQSVIERLAALPTLASIPREQLEWLTAHGEVRHFQQGHSISTKGQPIQDLFIILAGRISIRLDRGGISRIVKEWKRGDVSGYLPYSRLSAAPGDVLVDEPFEALVVPNAAIRDMTRECYEFTALCVHEMLDRARQFKSDDLFIQKLASLGVLSAGIAHELNNPSSAVARSAKELEPARAEVVSAARAFGAAHLSEAQLAAIEVLDCAEDQAAADLRSPLDRADREDAIADWLDGHGIDPVLAEPLARTTLTTTQLDAAARALDQDALALALRYVAANLSARRLTGEIVKAAERIHELAARVKKQTHMDRAPVVDAIPLEESLADTLALIGSKARSKAVTLELKVDPNLPRLQGVLGELNQVWLNLIDNAIDAAPEGGHVTVAAGHERDSIVVRVIDDGLGIAAADRDQIFDQFYTTKPVGKGTGLGLPTAQAIVLSHRGTIQVESRPGRTEFRVCLPAAESGVRPPFRIVQLSNGTEVSCHALVIASGMAVRELDVRGITPLIGAGVYYGTAPTEAALYRDQDVCVVGGANSAGQGALFLSRSVKSVTMIVRAADLTSSMSQYLIDRIAVTSNIRVVTGAELSAVCGNGHVERIDVKYVSGAAESLPAAAVFIFIGVAPRTGAFAKLVQTDEKGFIITGPDVRQAGRGWALDRDPLMFETSVPGVFAVGDVRSGANRRIAAAVGEGSAAIFSVHQYLRTV